MMNIFESKASRISIGNLCSPDKSGQGVDWLLRFSNPLATHYIAKERCPK